MEPNESNLKAQSTGGLKLMTVFIAVLALHVLVIGGFTVWHLLYPANPDSDLAVDKAHKTHIADTTLGDVPATDTASTDTKPAATDADAPASDTTAAASSAAAAPTPAPATSATTVTSVTVPATPSAADTVTTVPAAPTPAPQMAEDASSTAANASTPSGPVHHGPVVTPAANLAPPVDSTAATAATADTAMTSSPAAAAAPADAVAAAPGTPYTVKHGDSLARIAHRHHVTVAKLREANSLASDALHIGQKLMIPAREPSVAHASHAAPVADENTVATEEEPAPKAAPVSAPVPSDPIAPRAQPVTEADGVPSTVDKSSLTADLPKHAHHASSTHHLYTVVRGDTLTKIAKRYHTTTSALVAANGLSNAGRLSIGQKLHIPSHEARASATAEEAMPRESEPHTAAKGQLANYVP